MKSSRYNIFFEQDKKQFAFNGLTCALAQINDDFINLIESVDNLNQDNLKEDDKSLLEDMVRGGFVVEDYFDEMNFLKYKSYRSKFGDKGLSLTIAPTLYCNFACPYCYESPQNGIMSQGIMDAICNKVEESAKKNQNVSINWYGGEPLVAKNVIWKLSDKMINICDKYGVKYRASMVTNGYLFDEETIDNIVKYKVNLVQITVDGPPDIHNTRRKLKNSNSATFDTIINNIKKLVKQPITVVIRINIDKTNVHRLDELLDLFISYGFQDCKISLGHVLDATEACESIADTCLDSEEYSNIKIKYYKILMEKGFKVSSESYYPKIRSNYCGADSSNAFVVDHLGLMYKCWHDIGNIDKSIGNILDVDNMTKKNIMVNASYMLWSPFTHEKCRNCDMLPLCMGGCPAFGYKNSDPSCDKIKDSLIAALKLRCFCDAR